MIEKIIKKPNYMVEIDIWGTKTYYNLKWKLHRVGGPAVIGVNGYKAWLFNGKYNKVNGYCIESYYMLYEKDIEVNIGKMVI